ncbi:YrrC family ATP-dependent DNA helicase, partial [Desulfovibrio sp. 1188_IL3213]|uniref:YrrC family ATP-dependent DNA helicase n=1 Tax=Desulfovibrio sp. 1188_IL3213 TaxID=3084052 RepID=UPI003FA5D871
MKDMPLLQDPDAVEISGTVERVIFHNEENGCTVLRLMPAAANSGGGDGGLT